MAPWKKFKEPYPYVEVWWSDAASLDAGWLESHEWAKEKKGHQIVCSRGWLIEETEDFIFYCCDVGPKGETNGRGQILKKMVLEIRYVSTRKVKKEVEAGPLST